MLDAHQGNALVARHTDTEKQDRVTEDSTVPFIEWHCHKYQEAAMKKLRSISEKRSVKVSQSRKRWYHSADTW